MNPDQYLHELSQFQGSISTLLENIQSLIRDLPDKRDNCDVVERLKTISKKLEELSTSISGYFKIDGEDSSDIKKLIGCLKEREDRIIKCLEEYKIIIRNIDDLKNDIIKTGQVSQFIVAEVERLSIIFEEQGREKIKITDFIEIIEFAKRANKRYNFWKGWKSQVAIVIGLVVGVLVGSSQIFASLVTVSYWLKVIFG